MVFTHSGVLLAEVSGWAQREKMLCEPPKPLWQVPGAELHICPVGGGKTLTGWSRSVFRSLTGSGMDGGAVAGWVLEIIQRRDGRGLHSGIDNGKKRWIGRETWQKNRIWPPV